MIGRRYRFSLFVDGVVYGRQTHGGINTFFNEILKRLAARPDVRVAIELPAECMGRFTGDGVKIWKPFFPKETGLSWKLDRLAKPTFDVANDLLSNLRQSSFSCWRAPCVFISTYFTSSRNTIPKIAVVHDMNHELFPELYTDDFGNWLRWRYREYVQEATEVICVSKNTRKDLSSIYQVSPDRIHVIYHAVNENTFRPATMQHPSNDRGLTIGNEPYILYVGARNEYKNFHRLLEGFAGSTLRDRIYLIVVGEQWKEAEAGRIQRLNLESRIRLIVNPADELLAQLYQRATAFIYPSIAEGFGIPLLEAMACETIVVAADIPVFREVAGDAALYFDPYSTENIAAALEKAVSSSSLRAEYIARGKRQVAKYSWDESADKLYAVCLRALEGH